MNARSLLLLCMAVLIGLCCSTATVAQVRLSSEDSEKLLLEAPEAIYPGIANAMRVQGIVIVEVTVSDAGLVISARAISGHPLLQSAAVGAVKKYKYKP